MYNGTQQVKCEVKTITPAMAKRLLSGNSINRKLSTADIRKIADDMVAGKFKLNGETIKVYDDGTLADGQHRLMACVLTGVPFTTVAVTGLPKDALMTIDTGKPRSIVDTLHITGYPIDSSIIGAMNYFFNYGNKLTANQVACLYNKYSKELDFISQTIKSHKQDVIIKDRSFKTICIWAMICCDWSEDAIKYLVESMSEMPTRDGDLQLSCYYYRNWYFKNVHKKSLTKDNRINNNNRYAKSLDALITLLCSDGIVKQFRWKNQAKRTLDDGFELAKELYDNAGISDSMNYRSVLQNITSA